MACISHGLGGRLNPSSPAAARTEMLEEFLWTSGGYSRLETTDPSRPCRSVGQLVSTARLTCCARHKVLTVPGAAASRESNIVGNIVK